MNVLYYATFQVKLSIIMIISDLHIYLCIRKLYMESEYCLQFTYMLELGRWRLIWSEVQQLTGSKQIIAVFVTDLVHCTPWMQTYHPSVIRKCIILYKFLFFCSDPNPKLQSKPVLFCTQNLFKTPSNSLCDWKKAKKKIFCFLASIVWNKESFDES